MKRSQRDINITGGCFAVLAMTILICFIPRQTSAQDDTSQTHGTIKIGKPKTGTIYIKAYKDTYRYDVSKIKDKVSSNMVYEPFPGEGYSYPFNYTRFFNDQFRSKAIDLRGKISDTVRIEIKVLANGKVYFKDRTRSAGVKEIPTFYDPNEKVVGYELSRIQLDCLDFLKQIKTWEPAYVEVVKTRKFKNQTVIKPKMAKIPFSFTLAIVFTTVPFDE